MRKSIHRFLLRLAYRLRPPLAVTPELLAKLQSGLDESRRLAALSDGDLVRECLHTDGTDFPVVEEMMSRLSPGWEND